MGFVITGTDFAPNAQVTLAYAGESSRDIHNYPNHCASPFRGDAPATWWS